MRELQKLGVLLAVASVVLGGMMAYAQARFLSREEFAASEAKAAAATTADHVTRASMQATLNQVIESLRENTAAVRSLDAKVQAIQIEQARRHR